MDAKERKINREMKKRQERDFQEIVKLVLASPLMNDRPLDIPTGGDSLEKISMMNTDVQTRMVAQMAYDAAHGDVKAAEFLMEYGGLKPAQKQEILIDVPQLVDDMTDRLTPAPPSPLALGPAAEEE